VTARQREHRVDAVAAQHLDGEPTSVRFHFGYRAAAGNALEETGERRDPGLGVLELRRMAGVSGS